MEKILIWAGLAVHAQKTNSNGEKKTDNAGDAKVFIVSAVTAEYYGHILLFLSGVLLSSIVWSVCVFLFWTFFDWMG